METLQKLEIGQMIKGVLLDAPDAVILDVPERIKDNICLH